MISSETPLSRRTIEIPFNRPFLTGDELVYVRDAIVNGHTAGAGRFSSKCENILQEIIGSDRALLTTSCTDALEMSALLLDLEPGDEVIVPSFTFVSTANAYVIHGATPVFADIRPDTLNIDDRALESLVTDRTRAIIAVHYAGVACEMEPILELASRRGIAVIEDNAHGLLGSYKERPLGSLGALATQSFHETKNITCGEGGALMINQVDLIGRAEKIREKGTNRSEFYRGQVDKYTWVDVGSSFLPSDLLAAYLLAQLERRDEIQRRRERIWRAYDDSLSDWCKKLGARRPVVPGHCVQPYHMYYLLMPDLATRDRFISHLREAGILAVFHYVPLHASPMGRSLGGRMGQCPVTETVSDQIVRLPFYTGMTESEQERVLNGVLSFSA